MPGERALGRVGSGAGLVGENYTLPVLLSVLGIILITISGWLGGEMVYVHGVAVEPQRDAGGGDDAKARVA